MFVGFQKTLYACFKFRTIVGILHENPTVGIVLCRDKKDAMVEMMLPEKNKRIFAAQYKTVLPSKEELKLLLENGCAT